MTALRQSPATGIWCLYCGKPEEWKAHVRPPCPATGQRMFSFHVGANGEVWTDTFSPFERALMRCLRDWTSWADISSGCPDTRGLARTLRRLVAGGYVERRRDEREPIATRGFEWRVR